MKIKKETVIQFGEGGFLRGFVDYFLQELNNKGLFDGSVVVVQPIEKGMCNVLMKQDCNYNLFLRGISKGEVMDQHIPVDIISRCVNPYESHKDYEALAENPDFRFIISNTTEAGIVFDEKDKLEDKPAKSFPGKLTQLLYKRYKLGLKGFIILSCELIDNNGEKLLECCTRFAKHWGLEADFINWMKDENSFCSTLVDRIVTGFPRDEYEELCKRIGEEDQMMDTAEVFHLWVIQGNHEDELPLRKAGFNVLWVNDVAPYKKRKVRILNGAHTAMVLGAYLYGKETVLECMEDSLVRGYLEHCIFHEIIPTIGESEENITFGKEVIERFSNPYIRHQLLSIALNSVSKFKVRVLPSVIEYKELKGEYPKGLVMSLASLIEFYRTESANDDEEIMNYMKSASVEDVLKREDYWGMSLEPLTEEVKHWSSVIKEEGMKGAYEGIYRN